MTVVPILLGAVLGLGVLLCWQGFRIMIDRKLRDADRRKGLWRLNAGLVLAVGSMVAFSYVGAASAASLARAAIAGGGSAELSTSARLDTR